MADGYMNMIDRANTLDDLDSIVEAAANNSSISNKDYEEIYTRSPRKAQSWSPLGR